MIWSLLKKALFLFDAERVHGWSVLWIKIFGKQKSLLRLVSQAEKPTVEISQAIPLWDLKFRGRLGLAAGFDKNAEILEHLPHLGFSFAEIGSVTPRPQPGNEQPRLYRFPKDHSLFNCMGFNNDGAEKIAARLEKSRDHLPSDFVVGVNLGKNKDTELDNAYKDYVLAARAFKGLSDYLVINVSSPNTPGLRKLQNLSHLKRIVGACLDETQHWFRRPPLLVKLAPELEKAQMLTLVAGLEEAGVDGFICSNTLGAEYKKKRGGLSGAPLTKISRERLKDLCALSSKPVISVGGIMSAEEAQKRIQMGAKLVQVYSGWIYGGPRFPHRVSQALTKQK